jgi:hypothetical protein
MRIRQLVSRPPPAPRRARCPAGVVSCAQSSDRPRRESHGVTRDPEPMGGRFMAFLRSSPPDEDRGRSSPRSRRRPARRHRPSRRPPPAPAARPRPSAPGYSLALHGPPTGKHEAGRRATPARPRAPNPSRRNDQRPRCRPPRTGAASSPRRARPQSAFVPAVPMRIFAFRPSVCVRRYVEMGARHPPLPTAVVCPPGRCRRLRLAIMARFGPGTREEPGILTQGAPVFPGSSRLGIEPKNSRVAGARPNHQADSA